MRPGAIVSTLIRVLSEPPIERGTKCKVVAITEDRQKLFIEGPRGQVVSIKRGDVFAAKQ